MGKFNLFGYNPPKKGVSKKDERASVQTDFIGFFYMLGRKFWNISNLNLLMAIYIIFVVAGLWLLSGTTWAFYTFLAVSLLLFGLMSVGTTYIVRGYVRGDPVYILSDFKYAIKSNWKQGLVLGIIDFLVIYLLVFDIFFWIGPVEIPILPSEVQEQSIETELIENDEILIESTDVQDIQKNNTDVQVQQPDRSFFASVSFYGCLFMLIIYLMMRNYIYIIAVTFKLSIFKILKNSFIFAFVGLKRNIMAFLGILVVCGINLTIFIYLPMVGVMLPLIITAALCSFIGAYAAYPVIKKYMITPYYDDEEVNEAYDKVFIDRE